MIQTSTEHRSVVQYSTMKTLFYERKLPHWQPIAASFFVTTRLYNSIPMPVLKQLREQKKELLAKANATGDKEQIYHTQKKLFALYDNALDFNPNGPYYLAQSEIAEIIKESFEHRDGKEFTLWAYTIMSNHIHFLITTYDTNTHYLWKIVQNLKKYTAREANKILGRTGNPFWEEEYYDHIVRNDAEFHRIERYIMMNPVKAGLIEKPEDWAWSYRAS